MALSYRRLLYKAGAHAPSRPIVSSKRFFAEGEDTQAKPYRPWPMDAYRYEHNAQHWIKKGYRPQDAQSDVANYQPEQLHLHQIEKRMEKFGKKYSLPDRVRDLFNEYGWQDEDERPFSVYGAAFKMSDHEAEKWGPGKKVTVTHYMHSGFSATSRQPIPPIQYMQAEQVRRVKGRLARFREWPQEVPSIWRSWNPYITIAAITGIGISKELFFFNSHDFKELAYLWGTWGFVASVAFDWLLYFHVAKSQEEYDRMFLPLQEQVTECSKWIDRLDAVPNFKTVFGDLAVYKKDLAERVLQRTLSNRVQVKLNQTITKLEQKMVEERSAEAELQARIRRQALAATLKHFDDPKVRKDFTATVLKDFSAANAAQLVAGSVSQTRDMGVFQGRYEQDLKSSEKIVMDEARAAGTLPWKFRSEEDKTKARLSAADKDKEFKAKIDVWAQTHNQVSNASLA